MQEVAHQEPEHHGSGRATEVNRESVIITAAAAARGLIVSKANSAMRKEPHIGILGPFTSFANGKPVEI